VNTASVLVVDDEPQIRRVLRVALANASYYVTEARDGREAIEAITRERPDLILLDINMPDMTGIETCSKLRLSFAGPIIMITVRSSERDKVAALSAGADDYVPKPFSVEELLARIRAALRRSHFGEPLPTIETPELTVDLEKRIVQVRGTEVRLTPKECEVLRVLLVRNGKPVSHKRLLQIVWGPDYGEETEKVRGVIGQLRKKIEEDPAHARYIVTEPWLGYRFQIPQKAAQSLRENSQPRSSHRPSLEKLH